MRTLRFSTSRFSMAALMIALLVSTPPGPVLADSSNGVQIKTIVTRIDIPPDGHIVLPPEIPAELRDQALAAIQSAPIGQAVVMAAPGVLTPELQSKVEKEVAKLGGTGIGRVLETGGSSGVALGGGVTPNGGQPLMTIACFIILVVIIIIVVAVVIYTLLKLCQKIPPPQTNNPPVDPYPAVVHHNGGITPLDLGSGSSQLWMTNDMPATNGFAIQYCTALPTTNWQLLCTVDVEQLCEATNNLGSVDYGVAVLRDTNGAVIASSVVSGSTNYPPVLMQQKSLLNVPFPGPNPDKLFLRVVPR